MATDSSKSHKNVALNIKIWKVFFKKCRLLEKKKSFWISSHKTSNLWQAFTDILEEPHKYLHQEIEAVCFVDNILLSNEDIKNMITSTSWGEHVGFE